MRGGKERAPPVSGQFPETASLADPGDPPMPTTYVVRAAFSAVIASPPPVLFSSAVRNHTATCGQGKPADAIATVNRRSPCLRRLDGRDRPATWRVVGRPGVVALMVREKAPR
jgi:hypothetical protein